MTTVELPRYKHVIDGRRVEAASGQRYDSVDPYLGMAWASAADGDAADVDLAVAAARRALGGPWGQLTGFGRAALMRRLGDLIARDADRLAEIETRDTGKLLREMRGQLATIPQWFSYFSGLADKLEGTTARSCRGTRRCCCCAGSWPRRWPRAARWWPSRRTTPRPRRSNWPR
jgi:aldehyde dehydrogenase (NAD+)